MSDDGQCWCCDDGRCWFCGRREAVATTFEGHEICGRCAIQLAVTGIGVGLI
jgi:hypothetical protein